MSTPCTIRFILKNALHCSVARCAWESSYQWVSLFDWKNFIRPLSGEIPQLKKRFFSSSTRVSLERKQRARKKSINSNVAFNELISWFYKRRFNVKHLNFLIVNFSVRKRKWLIVASSSMYNLNFDSLIVLGRASNGIQSEVKLRHRFSIVSNSIATAASHSSVLLCC